MLVALGDRKRIYGVPAVYALSLFDVLRRGLSDEYVFDFRCLLRENRTPVVIAAGLCFLCQDHGYALNHGSHLRTDY